MPDEVTTLAEIRGWVQAFVEERDWGQFHTPKNLCMALSVEVAELMEHFQWLDPAAARARCEDADFRAAVAEEAADVCCYLLSFINAMNLDLSNAVRDKMQKNAKKYPADRFLGRFELGRESPPTE